jgi:hypothetical protein
MCYTDRREFLHPFPIFPRKVELISKPSLLLVTFTLQTGLSACLAASDLINSRGGGSSMKIVIVNHCPGN